MLAVTSPVTASPSATSNWLSPGTSKRPSDLPPPTSRDTSNLDGNKRPSPFNRAHPVSLPPVCPTSSSSGVQCCKSRITRTRTHHRRRRQTLHGMERAPRHTRPTTWVTRLNLTAQTPTRFQALIRTRSLAGMEVGKTMAMRSLWEMWMLGPSSVPFTRHLFTL